MLFRKSCKPYGRGIEMLDLLTCIDMIAMGHYPPLIVHILFAD